MQNSLKKDSVGDRLKEERNDKTDLTQEEFAKVGEVSLSAQRAYESNRNAPNTDYLNKVNHLIDIQYVVIDLMMFLELARAYDLRQLSEREMGMMVNLVSNSPVEKNQLELMMGALAIEKFK